MIKNYVRLFFLVATCCLGNLLHGAAENEAADSGTNKPKYFRMNLFIAACNGDLKKAQEIMNSGVAIDGHNASGQTMISRALEGKDTTCLKTLVALGADCNMPDKNGETPTRKALRLGCIEQFDILFDAGADINYHGFQGDFFVLRAVQKGSVEDLKNCLARGANPAAIDPCGNQILHRVAWDIRDVEKAKACINLLSDDYDIDINVQNEGGLTLLHHYASALHADDSEMLKFVLQKGGDVCARSFFYKETPWERLQRIKKYNDPIISQVYCSRLEQLFQNHSATKIQTSFRGFAARQKVTTMKKLNDVQK